MTQVWLRLDFMANPLNSPIFFSKLSLADWLLVLIGSFIAVTIVHLCSASGKSFNHDDLRLPPGPRPWPVVGNLLQIGPIPHLGMMKFTKKYGPLVYFRFGTVPAVVTDDPQFVKEFLKKQDHVFSSRPKNIASEHFTFQGKDIAFAPYGTHWKDARKLCLHELLTSKKLESFRPGRLEEMQCMMKSVYEDSKQGKVINMRDLFGALSSNTLTRMLLGKRYFGAGDAGPLQAAEHKSLIYESFWLINAFNVGDYIPFLRHFDLQGHERRMKAIMRRVNDVYDAIIQEHRLKAEVKRSKDDGAQRDFLDVLLTVFCNDSESDMQKIKAILIDMVAAGTDTSSVTSEWTMAELLRHPQMMEKVQDEIDSVVGGKHARLVEEGDLNKLRYLRAVVKEVFRLHPVGPFLIPHLSIQPCTVGEYDIPKNTRVLINTYALGRNPAVWNRFTEFQPERFMLKAADDGEGADDPLQVVSLNDPSEFRIVPFGAGRRGCPGASLGTCVVLLGLARLIQGFRWISVLNNQGKLKTSLDDADMETAYASMVKSTPLQAIAIPRLPPSMYM